MIKTDSDGDAFLRRAPITRLTEAFNDGELEYCLTMLDAGDRVLKVQQLDRIRNIGMAGRLHADGNPNDLDLAIELSTFYGTIHPHVHALTKNGITDTVSRRAYDTLQFFGITHSSAGWRAFDTLAM